MLYVPVIGGQGFLSPLPVPLYLDPRHSFRALPIPSTRACTRADAAASLPSAPLCRLHGRIEAIGETATNDAIVIDIPLPPSLLCSRTRYTRISTDLTNLKKAISECASRTETLERVRLSELRFHEELIYCLVKI